MGKPKLQILKAVKAGKKRKIRATIFPREGGSPYVDDLEPDDDGLIKIRDGKSFHITRQSVWEEDGKLRCILNEGNPQTISPLTLTGDDAISPELLHAVAMNNYWVQLDELRNRKPAWKQATTWILGLLGFGIIGCLIWLATTTGNGFEDLKAALIGLKAAASPATGHQPIAPGG